jgi:PAS domain-containing protein
VPQKPLELILARNLMSALSTPAFLVDEGGLLVFYNEAAGTLLGKGFDEVGHVGPNEWGGLFGPYDAAGETIPYDDLPVVRAVRAGRPAHGTFDVRAFDGRVHPVECSAFPILTAHGSQGAIAIFWAAEEGLPAEADAAAASAAGSNGAAPGSNGAAA